MLAIAGGILLAFIAIIIFGVVLEQSPGCALVLVVGFLLLCLSQCSGDF